MGMANAGNPSMVFDWDKAARIIRERGATDAQAGLSGDWGYTGGTILADGIPDVESYTYLASTWAVPELRLGDGGGEAVPCYRMADDAPGWDAKTKWPASALAILEG